jgi:hypothetical protein
MGKNRKKYLHDLGLKFFHAAFRISFQENEEVSASFVNDIASPLQKLICRRGVNIYHFLSFD